MIVVVDRDFALQCQLMENLEDRECKHGFGCSEVTGNQQLQSSWIHLVMLSQVDLQRTLHCPTYSSGLSWV